jgi:carboxyl-terminal processing protease
MALHSGRRDYVNKKIIACLAGFGLGFGLLMARPLHGAHNLLGRVGENGVLTDIDIQAPVLASLQSPDDSAPADKLAPNPEDRQIAALVARLLVRYHYAHHPLDATTSSKWFDRYLDALDPMHFYFVQSDVQEFAPYRETIAPSLLDKGDTSAANKIFRRFLERMDQQTAYAKELLAANNFDFSSNDSFVVNRKDLPRPANLDEAKRVWRDRLRYEYLQEKLNNQKPEEILKTLTRRYDRTSRTLHELDRDDIFEIYLTSLSQVYDPHSTYMGKASYDNFGIQMRLSLAGIGATLMSEDGYPKIDQLIPGGPAARSGLMKVGDRITAVAQGDKDFVDVVDMKLDNAVAMIRGPKGTTVRLKIIPADSMDTSARKTVTLVRDEVKLEAQEAKAKVIDLPGDDGKTQRIAVLDVPSFYEDTSRRGEGGKSTTTDVLRLIKKLKAEKIDGMILDLRRNPGGSLTEAINLSGLFIKDGPIVQVKDTDGRVTVDKDPDPSIAYAGPLVVLTSRFSASASEILAGALQDYGRAVVVGDSSTHGKGSVQTLIELGPIFQDQGRKLSHDPGALKLTIQKFYRASGSSTQLKGVVPDIVVPSVSNVVALGEKGLDNPLPWDTIPSSTYTKLNWVERYMPELRKRSEARIATDPDFHFVNEQVARFQKIKDEKTVSLNEAQRRKEKQEAIAIADAHKKELANRKPSAEVVHDLTLKQVDLPGLPPASKSSAQVDPETKKPLDPDAAEQVEETNQSLDITLKEAKRILLDLVSLTQKTPGTAATVAGNAHK